MEDATKRDTDEKRLADLKVKLADAERRERELNDEMDALEAAISRLEPPFVADDEALLVLGGDRVRVVAAEWAFGEWVVKVCTAATGRGPRYRRASELLKVERDS